MKHRFFWFLAGFGLSWVASALGQRAPVQLEIDAREAPRRMLHGRMILPAPKSAGPLTLAYPKWLPGEHGPTGPVTDFVGLKVNADNRSISWRRDAEDMYLFHVDVPSGTKALEVVYDFLLPPEGDGFTSSASSTANLLVLSWNQVLLYPLGEPASEIPFTAKVRLPDGWKFASALPVQTESADGIAFGEVSLETLVDAPLLAGAHLKSIPLSPATSTEHWLHIAADSAAALDISQENRERFSALTVEAQALFGAHHYRKYQFLLTLSDHVAHFGLEHHESSDNRQPEQYLTDPNSLKATALLLPHEMVHSWNGKFRRPAGLATPDYQVPMQSELLWVYEGLTMYLGNVLTARSGLWTNENFREDLALTAAMLDHQAGRAWRPLADTTIAAQLLYEARPAGSAWRRSVDFYPEGILIWLEADVLIRQRSNGRRSLDDFCKAFYGGDSGAPRVVPYTYDDIVDALQTIASYDWKPFFQTRVYETNPRAPLGGIEGAGWRLEYSDTMPDMLATEEAQHKTTYLTFSLGLILAEDGNIVDVIPGSPADRAGVGATMKLIAVQSRRWTPALLRTAIKEAAASHAPIELLLENGEFFKTVALPYFEGEKYPHLVRDESKPDLLSEILKPGRSERH